MIVRLMGGDGQFRIADDTAAELNAIDNDAVDAIEAGDEARLRELLHRMAEIVRSRGEPLDPSDLSSSDCVIPPEDLSLEEAKELFSGDGLIPDLPT